MNEVLHELGLNTVINFVIFVSILGFLLRKPLKSMIAERHNTLRVDIEATREQLAEAQKKFQDYSLRIQSLDQEVATIVQEARMEAEASRVRIITQAKRMADGVIIDAKRGAESMVGEYKQQVRSDLANQVIARAEQMIRQKLNEADRERLKNDFWQQVGVAR